MAAPAVAPVVDLRSDTVTRPTAGMRRAMAEAAVGDDVYGDDPTVNALQARVAELLGAEAALWVPSGSMANQIALKVHCRPGDDVIVGEGAHNYFYESGAGGALAGVQFTVVGEGGLFTAADVVASAKPDNHHQAPTTLVCVENTHNRGGGKIWPAARVAEVQAAARAAGCKLHLDGARLWNVAAATGVPLRALVAGFDTVAVCLSKGLGAPAGSLLAGARATIHTAHRVRKMFGGGLRQAGILAAAGDYALDHHLARLPQDHATARLLADRLVASGHFTVPVAPETNIVIAELATGGGDAAALVERARSAGVLINAISARRVRLVTHLDVDAAACERAAAVLVAAAA